MSFRLVLDTNVFVAALRSESGASRFILRLCLQGKCQPLIGEKLFKELGDVIGRPELAEQSPLSSDEREELLDAYLSICEWVPVYYLWRPNLQDEGDNHLIELAVAGGAQSLVTHNVSDFQAGQLRFPHLEIQNPAKFLSQWRTKYGDDDNSDS